MELRRFLRLLDVVHLHRHRLDVVHLRLHLLDVGYAGRHVLDVVHPDPRVPDVDRPDLRVVGVDRHPAPDRLDVDRAGRHVLDVRHPGHLRRAYPAGKRTGCCLGVDRLDEERPDVVHGRLRGFGRDVRPSHPNAFPAGMRMGCCLGVEHLALGPTWPLALVLHLEVVRPGLP